MASMNYCKFENTVIEFRQCVANFEGSLSDSEANARKQLVHLAFELIQSLGIEDESDIDGVCDDLQNDDEVVEDDEYEDDDEVEDDDEE